MSPEVRVRLFEPFFTTKPHGRGTGLGLATVYGIVKESGGYILVESVRGNGTSFRMYLPIESAPLDSPVVQRLEAPEKPSGAETILVVEDNAALRRLTERVLQRHGFRVLVAVDGAQAQRICAEYSEPIHVALLDVVMPGESGPTVGEWIRRQRPEAKIVYMSGYTSDAIDRHRVLDPSNVFLQKPFDAPQLVRAVQQALSG
jgi:CheY-like chemotaxis protein